MDTGEQPPIKILRMPTHKANGQPYDYLDFGAATALWKEHIKADILGHTSLHGAILVYDARHEVIVAVQEMLFPVKQP